MAQSIDKWGNSLGLRIPKSFAEQVHLKVGSEVTIEVIDGNLVVKPKRKKYNLDELLAGITPENVHAEVDLGAPIGNEIW